MYFSNKTLVPRARKPGATREGSGCGPWPPGCMGQGGTTSGWSLKDGTRYSFLAGCGLRQANRKGFESCSQRKRPAGTGLTTAFSVVFSLQFRSLLQVFLDQGEPRRRRSYPAGCTPDPKGGRLRTIEISVGNRGRWARRKSEGVQGIGRRVLTCVHPLLSAPAHPSWRPEPRQRSLRRGLGLLVCGPAEKTPQGLRWATRAKRRREGGGKRGAGTQTRAEPAGEAERAWEPGAPVAGPPPATAECPRCLPAGPL